MNITLRQLEVFKTVATTGNVTQAAKELCLSQSAASMALAELERQLNQPLFDRHHKRLLLNERGRALLPKSIDILSRIDDIEALLANDGRDMLGDLRIGASSTIGNYLLPSIIGQFSALYPGIKMELQVGNTEQIVDAVRGFKVDVGLIEGVCHDPEIDTTNWRRDQLAVFASPSHPLCRKTQATAKDLLEAEWILRERGSGTREIFENAIADKLESLHIRFELGHTEAIKQAVEAGLSISCLSLLTLQRALEGGQLQVVPTPFLQLGRWFTILTHKSKFKTDVLQRFLGHLLKHKTVAEKPAATDA
jgi:DNA-binding transcriptional LysR family regulator